MTFHEHQNERLNRVDCTHWNVAVYKWEGLLTLGEHAGKEGVLIGETQNLRRRINQYKTGTEKSRNKYRREQFLTKGDIRLWVLNLNKGSMHLPREDNKCIVNK